MSIQPSTALESFRLDWAKGDWIRLLSIKDELQLIITKTAETKKYTCVTISEAWKNVLLKRFFFTFKNVLYDES